MRLFMNVSTCGENSGFGFAAEKEIDYFDVMRLDRSDFDEDELEDLEDTDFADIENPEDIDWDYIRDCCYCDTLEEAFWESMNANPEREIIELMKVHPEYTNLRELPIEVQEERVYSFIQKTLITSKLSCEIDDIDVTEKIGFPEGKWDDMIFTYITDAVMDRLRKMWTEGKMYEF